MSRLLDRLVAEAEKAVVRRLVRTATRRIPVDTGQARGNVVVTVGVPTIREPVELPFYPVPGDPMVDAALAGLDPGKPVFVTWTARHAAILEGGRRVGPSGRILGSLQAPDGFLRLSLEETARGMHTWRLVA